MPRPEQVSGAGTAADPAHVLAPPGTERSGEPESAERVHPLAADQALEISEAVGFPGRWGTRADFEAIGTHWQIDTPDLMNPGTISAVRARVDRFDRDWSRFRPDSWVTGVALAGAGTYSLPTDAGPLLDAYDLAADCTDDAVDPLVGQALEDLGYDAGYRLRPRLDARGDLAVAPAPSWRQTAHRADGTLTLDQPALLDVGAAGKGYLVDLVSMLLIDHGHPEHTVDAGGDLRTTGALTVALEDPRDPTRAIGTVRVDDAALAGSATNRRAWGHGLHHVVDARTGRPTTEARPTDVIATWALAPTTLTADLAATMLFFADPDLVAARFGIRYVVLTADGGARWSLDLPGEVFA